MMFWKSLAALLCSGVVVASRILAHDAHPSTQIAQAEKTAPVQTSASVPLYDDLGILTYPITVSNPLAQRYFDQGLRLTYAFNHAEARRAFREAQRLDQHCAMCYWGEAFVLGPNINAPMEEEAEHPAVTAITKAQALAPRANARAQALIHALAKRYAADPKTERAALNRAYAEAMTDATRRFPDDPEIAVLSIDAIMNLAPWDYWEVDGKTPKGQIGEAIRTAEHVLVTHPDHPGAIHLYIHLTEASTTPERAEPYANRLAALMPGAGHLVHMGSHTFFRVGRYEDSTEANKAAVKADEAYLAQGKAEGIYPYAYYPHNIHFVIVSAHMTGDGKTALEYVQRLEGKIPDALAEKVGLVQPIKAAPYFAHAQFSPPETILALPAPGAPLPFVKAMWHYARGIALVTQSNFAQAQREAAHMAELQRKADFSALLAAAIPAADIIQLARHVLEGRLALAQGNAERAIKEFQVAVSIQDSLAYMEPPYWYYPVRQSLGAALLIAGKPAEAEQAFQQSLVHVPNNGWALYSLMKAQQAQSHEAAAQETAKRLQQAWTGDPATLDLKRL